MGTMTRRIPALLAAVTAAMAFGVVGTGSAHAASGCWDAGHRASAPHDNYEAWNCNNRSGAAVYGSADPGNRVGTMDSDPSWFACKTDSGAANGEGSGPHPNRWLLTKADNGAWGWMSDKDVSSETDPVPNC